MRNEICSYFIGLDLLCKTFSILVSCSCHTVKYGRNLAWGARESVTDVERRDIGQKTVPRDQADPVGTGLEGVVVLGEILIQEIHMLITTATDIPHHQWTDSGHIQIPMTGDPHPRGIPTTETVILMQDHHQSITEDGKWF